MDNVYNINGFPFWTEREIRLRNWMTDHFAREVQTSLLSMNPAWQFFQVEAPILTPRALINPNYTEQDVWVQQQLASDKFESMANEFCNRPETTPGSYAYASYLMRNRLAKPPFVVWQIGKSFRRELDQPTKHMRLKEFYQQEFQCLFTSDTKRDYHKEILEPVRKMIGDVIALPTRIVESDRLPSYSLSTMDVEVDNGDKWMEVCSISKRTDFQEKAKFVTKDGVVERDILVCEIAIGSDRCIFNYMQRIEPKEMSDG